MTKTHRTAAAFLSLLAGMVVLPSAASAASVRERPAISTSRSVQNGRSYSTWANNQINGAVDRIFTNANRLRLSHEDRSLLVNNTNHSANILRQRIRQVSADGKVTASERHQVHNLTLALQAELRKAHGNIDSFWLL